MHEESGTLDRGDGVGLAWRRLPGLSPTVVFLPGLRSHMLGEKATMLAAFCAGRGQACLRFDYSGHGASGGRLEEGTVGRWTADALAAIDALSAGPVLLVGSSMGGWIGLLAALARTPRVAGLVGVAAAPDFTEALVWAALDRRRRAALMRHGSLELPNAYGEPLTVTRALIEDGRRHLLLGRPIKLACPVRLLHGQRDADVPWQTTLRLSERIVGQDVQVMLVKDGDHRLSRPSDLQVLRDVVGRMLPHGPASSCASDMEAESRVPGT